MNLAPDTAFLFDYGHTLQACAHGERQALQVLYQQESQHLPGVALRIVYSWPSGHALPALTPRRRAGRGWIYSITRNLALNIARKGAREVSVDEETAEALDAQGSMEAHRQVADAFELNASLGKLNDCLSRLEPARRNCILYTYVDGCSHSEIAARTQTPLGTVKDWIKRSMGSLGECMR